MSEQVVFHGGCVGCIQQELHGVDFCFDCQYFTPNWGKPSLYKGALDVARQNEPPSRADIVREEVINRRSERRGLSLFKRLRPLHYIREQLR